MKKYLKYSILRYSPSSVAGEKINLGIVVYDDLLGVREFRYTKKFKRLASFDDEIDLKNVKLLLKDIKEELEVSLISDTDFNVENYIKYYNNDFSFDSPKRLEYTSFDETLNQLYRIYFRFDFEKSERPDKADEVRLMEEIIRARSIEYKKNQYVVGDFNERLKYDIITDKYKIKIFDFDGKDLSKLINSVKAWAFNFLHTEDKELLFVYRYSDSEKLKDPHFSIIMSIFKTVNAEIYDIDDSMQLIQKMN